MKLSVVSSLYNSAPYLREFFTRVSAAAKKITSDYEIILVDDGSPDDSLETATAIAYGDPKVTVVELSRNFGHPKALMTGLSYATGDFVFLIDCDLEESPEWLETFWQTLHEYPQPDVVYGVQEKRKGGVIKKISEVIYYILFNLFSDVKVPANFTTCRLMRKNYVEALLKFSEREVVIAGLFSAAGFKQKAVSINKPGKGKSTHTFSLKLVMLIDSIASFSNRPLVWIFYVGSGITGLAGCYVLTIVVKKIFYGISIIGWTSIIASVWLIGGMVLLSIGVVGLYLSKIFSETKNRPFTIIRKVHKSGKA